MKSIFIKINNKLKQIKIFNNHRIFFVVPLIVILAAIICGTVYQLSPKYDKFANVGVDFQGGTLLNVEMYSNIQNVEVDMNTTNKDYNVAIIEKVIDNYGFSISTMQSSGNNALVLRYTNISKNKETNETTDYGTDAMTTQMKELNDSIMSDIVTAFKNDVKYKDYDITINTTASTIGTSSSMKLLRTALISVSIALAAMFLYIIIRFDFFSALSTAIGLLHDIILMMAFVIIFRIEINSTIIAVIITIESYSINNNIIVFDRLRDNMKPFKQQSSTRYDIPLIVDSAIRSTITRTIYTFITTFSTIFAMAIMGIGTIKSFALPIIFGLFTGFYSAIVIAAPLWGIMIQARDKRRKNKVNTNSTKDKIQKPKDKKVINKFASENL